VGCCLRLHSKLSGWDIAIPPATGGMLSTDSTLTSRFLTFTSARERWKVNINSTLRGSLSDCMPTPRKAVYMHPIYLLKVEGRSLIPPARGDYAPYRDRWNTCSLSLAVQRSVCADMVSTREREGYVATGGII